MTRKEQHERVQKSSGAESDASTRQFSRRPFTPFCRLFVASRFATSFRAANVIYRAANWRRRRECNRTSIMGKPSRGRPYRKAVRHYRCSAFGKPTACIHDFHGNILVASTCIHDFHAKKNFPFNSPFLHFVPFREIPPSSQQISASTCNGQLRPPKLNQKLARHLISSTVRTSMHVSPSFVPFVRFR